MNKRKKKKARTVNLSSRARMKYWRKAFISLNEELEVEISKRSQALDKLSKAGVDLVAREKLNLSLISHNISLADEVISLAEQNIAFIDEIKKLNQDNSSLKEWNTELTDEIKRLNQEVASLNELNSKPRPKLFKGWGK